MPESLSFNKQVDCVTSLITPTGSSRWVIVYATTHFLLGDYLTYVRQVGIVGQTETAALKKAGSNRKSVSFSLYS